MSAEKHHRLDASSRVEPLCDGLRYLRQQNQTEDVTYPRLVHLSTQLNEKQLEQLTSKLFEEFDDPEIFEKSWEKLVLALGSSNADIYKHKINHMYNPWSMCLCLYGRESHGIY